MQSENLKLNEKDGYFINAWLLLKFPHKVQLLKLV